MHGANTFQSRGLSLNSKWNTSDLGGVLGKICLPILVKVQYKNKALIGKIHNEEGIIWKGRRGSFKQGDGREGTG